MTTSIAKATTIATPIQEAAPVITITLFFLSRWLRKQFVKQEK